MLWVDIKLRTSDDYTDTGKAQCLGWASSTYTYPPAPTLYLRLVSVSFLWLVNVVSHCALRGYRQTPSSAPSLSAVLHDKGLNSAEFR